MSIDFSKYKNTYKSNIDRSIRFSGQTVDFFTEIKADLIIELARKVDIDIGNLTVLDLGCGIGQTDFYLRKKFKMLHGVDIAKGAVEKAKILNPTIDYCVYDGLTLPFKENTFDVVFAVCVMHHLRLAERNNFISEMKRVSKNGGLIMIFEHNPLNYLTRCAVARCEFDKDALLMSKTELRHLLSENALAMIDESYIIFLPFRGSLFRFIERGLRRLPLGAQYYMATKKDAGES